MKWNRVILLLFAVLIVGAGVVLAANHVWMTEETVTWDASDGPAITTHNDTDGFSTEPIPDATTVDFGDVSFESQGSTEATLQDRDDDTISLSDIDAGTELIIDHSGTQEVRLTGDFDTVDVWSVDLESNETELTVDGTGTVEAYIGSVADTVVIDVDGDETIQSVDDGFVEVNVDGQSDVSIFETRDPTIEQIDPADGEVVAESPITLQVDFSDPDAGLEGGTDEWDVTFFNADDDSVIGSIDIFDADDTAFVDWDSAVGGSNNWSVTIEDAYGNEIESDVVEVGLPDQLQIRDEQSAELIESEVTVIVEFFGEDTFAERSTYDGNISLEGLAPDETFVAVAEAHGYHDRRIIIRDLTQQTTIWLLDDEADTVDNMFSLRDETGDFSGPETILTIQRAVADSPDGNPQYRTVAGDVLGGTQQFPATLESNERYRILVENDGDMRDLGPYTAVSDGIVEVNVRDTNFGLARHDTFSVTTEIDEHEDGSETIRFNFGDPDRLTDRVDVVIHERGNASNVIHDGVHRPSAGSQFGNLSVTETIEPERANLTWSVSWDIHRTGDIESGSTDITASTHELSLPIPEGWQTIIAVGGIILVGGLFSARNAPVGAIIVPCLAGVMWLVGILPASVGGIAVAIALALGVAYNFAVSGIGGLR